MKQSVCPADTPSSPVVVADCDILSDSSSPLKMCQMMKKYTKVAADPGVGSIISLQRCEMPTIQDEDEEDMKPVTEMTTNIMNFAPQSDYLQNRPTELDQENLVNFSKNIYGVKVNDGSFVCISRQSSMNKLHKVHDVSSFASSLVSSGTICQPILAPYATLAQRKPRQPLINANPQTPKQQNDCPGSRMSANRPLSRLRA